MKIQLLDRTETLNELKELMEIKQDLARLEYTLLGIKEKVDNTLFKITLELNKFED